MSTMFVALVVLVNSACQSRLSADTETLQSSATNRAAATERPTPAPTKTPVPDGRLFTSEDGAYSFVLPEGWTLRDLAGFNYQVVIGPTRSDFALNLTVISEAFSGSLEDDVDANEQAWPASSRMRPPPGAMS